MISASAERIFELIADPSIQPSWDGNNNLASAAPGQRVHQVGDVFKTTLTNGAVRENHVVEFIEGSKIAWLSSGTREAAARSPLALGAQPDQPELTTRDPHLRLDRADRQTRLEKRSFDDARDAARVDGPAGHARAEPRTRESQG